MAEISTNVLVGALLEAKGKVRMGGVTIYRQEGGIRMQKSARPHCSGRKWKRTEGRARCVGRFAALRGVAEYLKGVYEELPVWRLAVERQGRRMRVDNYLMRVMWAYFDEEGRVSDFEGLPVSEGLLVPPSGVACEYADGEVRLTWAAGGDGCRARATDRLVVMWVRESRPGHVGRAKALEAVRGDGEARFELELKPGERLHVYPFFAAEDMSDFSRNGHACVAVAAETRVSMGASMLRSAVVEDAPDEGAAEGVGRAAVAGAGVEKLPASLVSRGSAAAPEWGGAGSGIPKLSFAEVLNFRLPEVPGLSALDGSGLRFLGLTDEGIPNFAAWCDALSPAWALNPVGTPGAVWPDAPGAGGKIAAGGSLWDASGGAARPAPPEE